MIDWKNKPAGAQRYNNNRNIANPWFKRHGDAVSRHSDDSWFTYIDIKSGLTHWNGATPEPIVGPVPPLRLTWDASPINATHILQNRISSTQDFAVRNTNDELVDVRVDDTFYYMRVWFIVSERPVEDVTVDSTINERGERYGKFNEGADIMQTLKTVMRETAGWERLTVSQREALEMIQHKIGRVLNGDPTYDDNWRDICGYSQLILDELNGTKR